jgi:hypothetical protein
MAMREIWRDKSQRLRLKRNEGEFRLELWTVDLTRMEKAISFPEAAMDQLVEEWPRFREWTR